MLLYLEPLSVLMCPRPGRDGRPDRVASRAAQLRPGREELWRRSAPWSRAESGPQSKRAPQKRQIKKMRYIHIYMFIYHIIYLHISVYIRNEEDILRDLKTWMEMCRVAQPGDSVEACCKVWRLSAAKSSAARQVAPQRLKIKE